MKSLPVTPVWTETGLRLSQGKFLLEAPSSVKALGNLASCSFVSSCFSPANVFLAVQSCIVTVATSPVSLGKPDQTGGGDLCYWEIESCLSSAHYISLHLPLVKFSTSSFVLSFIHCLQAWEELLITATKPTIFFSFSFLLKNSSNYPILAC